MPSDFDLDFEEPILTLERKVEELESAAGESEVDLSAEIRKLKERLNAVKRDVFVNLTPWQRVQVARNPGRPLTTDYLNLVFDDPVELHGDRSFRDDPAIVTCLARLEDRPVLVVGHRRGRSTRERLISNFGSAHPEGYRKALLKMKMAEKFRLPIITLINTPGAYPGIGAEERGQSSAIAINIQEMARMHVPIFCIVIGEGGSGGALGIGVGDRLSILENAYFSVISPEGCAAILWKDGAKAPLAAEVLKLAPKDLEGLDIVDEIIPEPLGGAHRDHLGMAKILKETLLRYLAEVEHLPMQELLRRRYQRHRRIGRFLEHQEEILQSPPPQDDIESGVPGSLRESAG